MASLTKSAFCAVYKYSGAMTVQERLAYWAGQRHVIVVLFHRVTDDIPLDSLTVSTAWFRDFCVLMQNRFNVVPLSEVSRILQAGETPPLRTVAITFDDCYRDNLDAARVLADHGLPATFFVPTKFVGTDYVFDWDVGLKPMPNLSWADLKEMVKLGHLVESHSVSHADFAKISPDAARIELADSKKILDDRLEQNTRFFAYPYGGRNNFRPEYNLLVRDVGYEACFSAYGGFIQPSMRGYVLPRQSMPYFRSLYHLEVFLAGCLDWVQTFKRQAGLY